MAARLACLVLALTASQALADPTARLDAINGYRVLTVEGDAYERGALHGVLLGETVRRVVRDVIVEGEGASDLDGLLAGAMVMERHLPLEVRDELRGLADATGVAYPEIVALQLFGDVKRGQYCTAYAVFGPATRTGECIVGRNMDYWDHGASESGAILLHERPEEGYDFLTCSWAGVVNGWTAINEHGIVCSNNSAYGHDSLEGLSTCFMVRKVVQFARTVEEGVEIVRSTPRACGTNLLIAGGDPPDAVVVEYDHDRIVVRRATDGVVAADNSFVLLGRDPALVTEPSDYSRHGKLLKIINEHYGWIDDSMNFACAPGAPIRSMNLHSALLFPERRALYVSMGVAPAADQPYRGFQLTPEGIVGLDVRDDSDWAEDPDVVSEGLW